MFYSTDAAGRDRGVPQTNHAPGTIIIRTSERRLYLVTGKGQALRYGIGVGKEGFTWAGVETVTRKAEWPNWTPPPEMLGRRPICRASCAAVPTTRWARARSISGHDLSHPRHERARTIGTTISSGCIRMTNDDITDLYNRVRVGATVIVQR